MVSMAIVETARPFYADGGRVGVLFCHGFTGSPHSLRDWAMNTAAAGYTVSLPRLPGHGTVWQELAVTSWRDWYDCVDAEYRSLAEKCDTVFVAGLSMGGSLALRLAEQHPEVAGLILVNPALGSTNPKAFVAPFVQRLVTSTESIGNDIAKPGVDEGSYDRTPTAGVAQLLKLWVDVKASLDLVTCPVVIYRSEVDNVVPGSSTETILRLASSTDMREVVLHRSLHVATMDYDADIIFDGTLEFIERVLAQTESAAT